jgi:hypothetical protein
METCFSETSVDLQHAIQRYIPEDITVHNLRCRNPESCCIKIHRQRIGWEVMARLKWFGGTHMVFCCECGNKPPGFIKGDQFFYVLSKQKLFNKRPVS